MQNNNLLHSNLHTYLLYDAVAGCIYNIKGTKKYELDAEYRIRYYNKISKKQIRLKANRIAWEIFNNKELPDGFVLYHKNLDEKDIRINNIAAVPRATYAIINEALDNLDKDLKLKAHPDVPHYLILQWREDTRLKVKVIQDIVEARKQYRKLLIKYTKILSKYLIT